MKLITDLTPKTTGTVFGLIVFLAITICVLIMARIYHEDQKSLIDEELSGLAGAAALLIDGDLHNSIREPDQINSSDYAEAVGPLVGLHNAFPRITYLYTMIEKSGDVYFILDTAADPRLSTQKVLEASAIMEAYETDSNELAGWLETLRTGQIFVDPELFTDDYGTFKSGSAPFYDSQGNYAGFVGVDYDVALFLARERQIIIAMVISLSIGGLLSVLVGVFVWRFRRDNELYRTQRDVAETELAEASNLLETALDSIDQGFLVWNSEHRVVICNDRYHELWNYPKGLLKPGTPLIDLIRFRAESGEYGEGDPEELADDMLKVILSRIDQPEGHLTTVDDQVLFTRHFSLKNFEYITICSDFTNLKLAEEALLKSENQYKQAAELANLGHWVWDELEDRMIYCSDEFARIYGISSVADYSAHTDALESDLTWVHPDDHDRVRSVLESATKHHQTYDIEYQLVTRDGRVCHVHEMSEPEFDENGVHTYTRGTVQDISKLKAMEKELRRAKEDAEKSDVAKSEFLAHMSHELRTPLNAITGFSQMMVDQVFGKHGHPKYLDYSQDIMNSGHHLLTVINDILDLSRIEAGEAVFHEESFGIRDVVEDSANMLRRRNSDHTERFNTEQVTEFVCLKGDKRLFKQIILNLLSNANKFTPDDGVITVSSHIDGDGQIVVKVTDTGRGIPSEDISKVLEPFGQARVDSSITHEGTGLGLPLSQKLIELHDGTLELASELGVGTVVTMTFPAERTVTVK